ncbi:hypothetical protein NXS19_004869 [Fusarium pseudograminearum]|nr:hypothetical protein NXS19_004869 [Fusarium pseudograminearum]
MYLKQVAMKALALPAIYQPTEPSAVPGILATKPSAVPGILATKPLAVLGIDKATEASAIQFRTGNELCGKDSYYIPDNQCSSLPGKWLYVAGITEDCRAFIYKNKDCTGVKCSFAMSMDAGRLKTTTASRPSAIDADV